VINRYGQFALPCRASSLRGKLKHSYLENAVCLPTLPEDLFESLTYQENGIERQQIIRQQISEFAKLLDSGDYGFSPAQLVDQLPPFQKLAGEERRIFKEQLHKRFCEDFQVTERKRRFESAAGVFLEDLDAFLAIPAKEVNSAEAPMLKVQDSARGLIRELETMPKGIWLWKPVKIERIPS
jgi:hypothetical protein